MRLLLTAAICTLAACSQPAPSNTAGADVNGAAEAAQGDIDTYAANRLASAPPVAAPATPAPAAQPTAAPTAAPTRPGTVEETPFPPESAQGAADVVQTYFALIEARKYGQAWALWGDGGRASGMTRASFATSFAKYADYHAEVGAPGAIEAGAGQRYVTVPVRAYGTLATRQPFELRGTVTLHRTAVDGATAAQRAWRISDSSLKPRPQQAAASNAPYACNGATRVSSRGNDAADGVWRSDAGKRCTAAAN